MPGDNLKEIESLKKNLAIEFEVKDLEKMQYFLDIEVARSKKEDQCLSNINIFSIFSLKQACLATNQVTPIEVGKKTKHLGEPVNKDKY